MQKMASGKGVHLTLVVNCVFNAFLSFTTIVLKHFNNTTAQKNSVVVENFENIAFKYSCVWSGCRLICPTPVRCKSCDEHTTKHWKHCLCYSIQSVFDPSKKISVLALHFGVISLTVDRILAIHLHLRYHWGACVSQACCCQLCSTLDSSFMPPIIVVVCVISTGLLYCKVYADTTQVQVAQNEDMANALRVKLSTLATFYVYVVFLVC